MLLTVLKGVRGLGKAAVGVDRADAETVSARREACRTCERVSGRVMTRIEGYEVLGVGSRCRECKCLVSAKTRLAGEQCPLGRW